MYSYVNSVWNVFSAHTCSPDTFVGIFLVSSRLTVQRFSPFPKQIILNFSCMASYSTLYLMPLIRPIARLEKKSVTEKYYYEKFIEYHMHRTAGGGKSNQFDKFLGIAVISATYQCTKSFKLFAVVYWIFWAYKVSTIGIYPIWCQLQHQPQSNI